MNFVEICDAESINEKIKKAVSVTPTKEQFEWQKMEMCAFVHFGMNTFTDKEWDDGSASPSLFNPTDFDPKQWVTVLKKAGFKGLILTCKHHDGFCLWPSKYTDYSVRQSPFKNGQGDVVREVSEACREGGLKFGVYLSPWDRHDKRYGDSPAYNTYFLNQLTELLTEYGDIYEVWFDGACAEGPNGKKQVYDWNAYYSLIRDLQPKAVISIEGPDVRWVGNEAGKGREEEWSVVPGCLLNQDKHFVRLQADPTAKDLASETALKALPAGTDCLYWSPAQVDTSIRQGWFFHEWENKRVKSLYELVKIYDNSVGANAALLLNIPPDTRGKISGYDEERLYEFGKYIKESFSKNLVHEISCRKENKKYALNLYLMEKAPCNCVVLSENIEHGQRVSSFSVEAKIGDSFKAIASGKTVGNKKIVCFPEIETDEIRVLIDGFRAEPEICMAGVYFRKQVVAPPQIDRTNDGKVTITNLSNEGITYTIDGGRAQKYTKPFDLERGGRVTAYVGSFDDVSNIDKCVSSTRLFGITKDKWSVVDGSDNIPEVCSLISGQASYILVDGFPKTIIIDLGEEIEAEGLVYQPISSALDFSYNVFEILVEASQDGSQYDCVYQGKLDNIKNNPVSTFLKFEKSTFCRFLKFTALSGFDGKTAGIGSFELVER